MSGYLDDLQSRLVAASRELSRARRRRVRRRGAWCAALVVLVTPPALAATGVWRPTLGDGEGPAPKISAEAPPPDQLAMLGVLRREQTEADRGVATRYALLFVDGPGLKGVRTNSIRLLTQSSQDRGVVLVPVEHYERRLPGDIPEELRKRVERTIDDALCVYQLDSVDGAGAACYSSADIREGRAWGMLGRRSLWIVPDGVASVRTEYPDRDPIVAPVHENAAIFTAPEGPLDERRTTWLDQAGKPVRVIEPPTGPSGPPPAGPAAGATRSGAVRSIGVQNAGSSAGYQVRVRVPHGPGFTVVLERPACAGTRRVSSYYGGLTREAIIIVTPDYGDRRLARWCPGTYRGFVRPKGTRKPVGTFSFPRALTTESTVETLRRIDAARGPLRLAMPSLSDRLSLQAAACVVVAAGGVLATPTESLAAAPADFAPGARTLGDPLFPTIGNGGYDVRHYDLDLDYAVASKRLEGVATIDAVATQGLSRFTLDLTAWNVVRRVTVDGRSARFVADAKRDKLQITPPQGIRDRRRFRVVVRYRGIQRPLEGTTGLKEGWIANPKSGAVVVAQPTGAMGWYPNNNVPADKATYTTRVTVPRGWSALATGVLASRRTKQARTTFVWRETAPTSSYLVSVSVGKFDVNSLNPAKPKKTKPVAGSLNQPLPFYTAITASLPAKGKAQSATDLGRSSEIVDFYSSYYGKRYPFTSLGGIVTLQSFGLGLETQGKPTYAITRIDRSYGPGVDLVAHELAHQFFGNLVTPARWRDVWLSEGMAVFSAWVWSSTGSFFPVPPRVQYLDVYANPNYPISWRVPPANAARPQDLFDRDGIYRRAPATIEAIREILGNDATFKAMMRRWLTEHAYGSATTEQFIALVKRTDRARAARWTEFFRQWLYTSYPTPAPDPGQPPIEKPQIHVDNFDTYVLPAR